MIINNIKESYCSFEVCKLLKEKGFNVLPENTLETDYIWGYEFDEEDPDDKLKLCEFQFEDVIQYHKFLRPTHALAIEWLRVNYNIWISVMQHKVDGEGNYYESVVNEMTFSGYNSPQEATEAALLYTLTNLIK